MHYIDKCYRVDVPVDSTQEYYVEPEQRNQFNYFKIRRTAYIGDEIK